MHLQSWAACCCASLWSLPGVYSFETVSIWIPLGWHLLLCGCWGFSILIPSRKQFRAVSYSVGLIVDEFLENFVLCRVRIAIWGATYLPSIAPYKLLAADLARCNKNTVEWCLGSTIWVSKGNFHVGFVKVLVNMTLKRGKIASNHSFLFQARQHPTIPGSSWKLWIQWKS